MRKPVNISTFAAVKTFCLTHKTLKGMKKLMYLALAFIAIATGFTACQQQKNVSLQIKNDGVSFDSVAPFFYKAVFKDYNFNAGRAMVNDLHMGKKATFFPGGCTEIRQDNQVGRNLDWNVNYEAAAVLWMQGTDTVQNDTVAKLLQKKQRHSSVGMVGANPRFTYPYHPEDIKLSDTLATILPLSMTDGINERRVYIGVNVAPAGETSLNPENWNPGVWGNGAAYTQKDTLGCDSTKNAMCVTYLTRIVLNYADSVGDAIKIIESLNWFEPYEWNYNEDKTDSVKVCQAFHWLICDKDSSVVVEFMDNKMQVIKEPSLYARVMTNFSNTLFTTNVSKHIQHGGCGYERFDSIRSYIDLHKNNFNMTELMHKFHYSKFFHEYYHEAERDSFRHYSFMSEFENDTLSAAKLYPNLTDTERFINVLKTSCSGWPDLLPLDIIRKNKPKDYWYTTHTSIYNLTNTSFKVLIHEGYDEKEKNSDGSKKIIYREFALDQPGVVNPNKTNKK